MHHGNLIRFLCIAACAAVAPDGPGAGLPPMRPLPEPSTRPMAPGPACFADPRKGDDRNDGSKEKPWKTVGFALGKLKPGDTLYLRGGVYHERPRVLISGEKGRPITIRGYPGELAILDGGLTGFLEDPAGSWEPVSNGAADEYVSKQTFPDWGHARLLGNFADSMVTLHGYRFMEDFRAPEDGVWRLKQNDDPSPGVYLGPGLWFDEGDRRIHVRLSRTRFAWLRDEQNYRGETDPRKVPLVISGGSVEGMLTVRKAGYLRFQDLVLRGAGRAALLDLQHAANLEFDGVTLFGGWPSLEGLSTRGLRMVNCAFRGLGSAPWESRAGMKYRGKPGYMVVGLGAQPQNQDWEFAQCEFTDGHDFALLRHVRNVRIHHCLVDNFNDDGFEMGPRAKDQLAWIYCNRITRCLGVFTQHEARTSPEAEPDSGVFIFRNVIDMRAPTYGSPQHADRVAAGQEEDRGIWRTGELGTDHESPLWANYYFYQNTVLREGRAWRNHYAFGLGERGLVAPPRPWMGGVKARPARRIFNNLFVQNEALAAPVLPSKPAEVDLQVDGNLFWGGEKEVADQGNLFAKFRQSPAFEASKKQYPPGWGAHDLVGNPAFAHFPSDEAGPEDLSLTMGSPAVNTGVPIPAEWPDVLREKDEGGPDLGAVPLGSDPERIGVRGRFTIFGQPADAPRPNR